MTVRAARVIGGIMMIPVADDTCGKDQEREQRQANPEDANRLPHGDYRKSEPGNKIIAGSSPRRQPAPDTLNTNVMWDARKALPVTPP
jgi:hypothetical protein